MNTETNKQQTVLVCLGGGWDELNDARRNLDQMPIPSSLTFFRTLVSAILINYNYNINLVVLSGGRTCNTFHAKNSETGNDFIRKHPSTHSEAEVMLKILKPILNRDIPIALENNSIDTLSNALEIKKLIPESADNIIILTNFFHKRRVNLIFNNSHYENFKIYTVEDAIEEFSENNHIKRIKDEYLQFKKTKPYKLLVLMEVFSFIFTKFKLDFVIRYLTNINRINSINKIYQ